MKINLFGAFLGAFFLTNVVFAQTKMVQPVYQDKPYLQDYSVKYYTQSTEVQLESSHSDRNGNISVFSSSGLLIPHMASFCIQVLSKPIKNIGLLATKRYKGLLFIKINLC